MDLQTLLRGLTLSCFFSCATLSLAPPAAAAALVNNNAGATGTSQFTQSSSSTLGFGSTVIVIYNDSGSFAGTGNQFTGYARSTDGGSTFTDLGRLPANALGDAGTAHLARHTTSGAVYTTALSFTGGGLQVYRSNDGGLTFGAPVSAAPGVTTANNNAIAVDNAAGAGNGTVYVATEVIGAGGGLRLFRSTDGGATFGGGVALSASSSSGLLPSLAVGPDHRVSVAYLDTTGGAQVIRVRSSADGGVTFGAASVAATLATTGASGDLGLVGIRQGTGTTAAGFRTSAAPQLAANPATGQLYLVYNDNPAGADKADVFVRTSSDGGATWSAAQRMNTDAGSNDQWHPTLAVTPDGGHLGVFWYDRRGDAGNNLIRYYGRQCDIIVSALDCDADFEVSNVAFLPEFGRDSLVLSTYMGDYDNAFADADFFYVSFSGNQDDLPGGAGRKDPNVYFTRVAVEGSPAAPAPEPASAWLMLAAWLAAWPRALRSRLAQRRRLVVAASVATALGFTAPVATAAPVPAYATGGQLIFGSAAGGARGFDDLGTFEWVDPILGGALRFESGGTPAPSLRANAAIGPSVIGPFGRATGSLQYTFVIDGPLGALVPVVVSANGHAAGTATDEALFAVKSSWALRNASGFDLLGDTIESGLVIAGSFDRSFARSTELLLRANAEYVVFMSADAQADTQLVGGPPAPGAHADAEAFVDPIFRFGAGVDAGLYAFRFSEGIGNGPAGTVPEPALPALVALGCAALASSRRRAAAPGARPHS